MNDGELEGGIIRCNCSVSTSNNLHTYAAACWLFVCSCIVSSGSIAVSAVKDSESARRKRKRKRKSKRREERRGERRGGGSIPYCDGRCRKTTSMSSDSGYSRTRDKGDEYGQGNRYTMTYTEQSTEKGMGIHPSIGCFSEKDQANPLHSKKPNVGATASKTYDGQSLATHSNHGTHQQDSASSDAGGIVNLRSPSSTEGKAKKPASKGKK